MCVQQLKHRGRAHVLGANKTRELWVRCPPGARVDVHSDPGPSDGGALAAT